MGGERCVQPQHMATGSAVFNHSIWAPGALCAGSAVGRTTPGGLGCARRGLQQGPATASPQAAAVPQPPSWAAWASAASLDAVAGRGPDVHVVQALKGALVHQRRLDAGGPRALHRRRGRRRRGRGPAGGSYQRAAMGGRACSTGRGGHAQAWKHGVRSRGEQQLWLGKRGPQRSSTPPRTHSSTAESTHRRLPPVLGHVGRHVAQAAQHGVEGLVGGAVEVCAGSAPT